MDTAEWQRLRYCDNTILTRFRLVTLWASFFTILILSFTILVLILVFTMVEGFISYLMFSLHLILIGVSYFFLKPPLRCHFWLSKKGSIVQGPIDYWNPSLIRHNCKSLSRTGIIINVCECRTGIIIDVCELGCQIRLVLADIEQDRIVCLPAREVKIVKKYSLPELLTSPNPLVRKIGLRFTTLN